MKEASAFTSVPFWDVYCSTRQAIEGADASPSTPPPHANDLTYPRTNREQQAKGAEAKARRRTNNTVAATTWNQQEEKPLRKHKGKSGGARQRKSNEADHHLLNADPMMVTSITAVEREDECLGIVAESFAEELDLLRKDEHFRGSVRDVAAMADMMR